MSAVGFTASRELSLSDRDVIYAWLDNITKFSGVDSWVTGACIGGDAFIAKTIAGMRPDTKQLVIVPSDRSRVEEWWMDKQFSALRIEVEYMPEGTTYKDRNRRIVESCNGLVGFPLYPEKHGKSLRSGTWQTIRMAKKLLIPTQAIVLRDSD
jgi:hypothetical protein